MRGNEAPDIIVKRLPDHYQQVLCVMALTLTVAQLSEAVRLTVSGSPAPPYLAIVTRQLSTATEIMSRATRWTPRTT